MNSSLIPERPLLISPTLAATIGLEEAIMLQVLADFLAHRSPEIVSENLEPNMFRVTVNEIQSLLFSLELIGIHPALCQRA